MKGEHILSALEELAHRMNIIIYYQTLKDPELNLRSGRCSYQGKEVIIIDSQLALAQKIEILARELSTLNTENIYILPYIRELLNLYRKNKQ